MPDVTIFLQFGALGIVALGAHFVLTKAIPSLAKTFVDEVQAQRAVHVRMEEARTVQFLGALAQQRADFLASLKEHREEIERSTAAMQALTRLIDKRLPDPCCKDKV